MRKFAIEIDINGGEYSAYSEITCENLDVSLIEKENKIVADNVEIKYNNQILVVTEEIENSDKEVAILNTLYTVYREY